MCVCVCEERGGRIVGNMSIYFKTLTLCFVTFVLRIREIMLLQEHILPGYANHGGQGSRNVPLEREI